MKTMRLATWALAAVPPVLLALCWGGLPDRVPVHWGLDGAVTYGTRWELVVPALLPLLLLALLRFLPRLDPRRKSYARFQREYDGFALPAGNYTALRVVIGEGEGQNWWCVAFPPLCLGAASETVDTAAQAGYFSQDQVKLVTGESEGYVLKFKGMELLGQLEAFFS